TAQRPMSALGQKQTFAAHQPMSALCQKRTITEDTTPCIVYGEPVTLIALRVAAIYASSGLFARGSWHAFHFISPVCGHNVEYSDHRSGYGGGRRFGRRS